ncbi:MAG: hypothetical protein KIS66_13855 [Fimbriimonadaceae bacterium]|nr:hypothetical protein [Fimbriimonadaceae bacterium]
MRQAVARLRAIAKLYDRGFMDAAGAERLANREVARLASRWMLGRHGRRQRGSVRRLMAGERALQ